MQYSGIGGQAVLEGIMMKNKEQYAVAVRKPDGEIEIEIEHYLGILHESKLKNIPFMRGVFQFLDSMILGMRSLNYSASFYEDADAEETMTDKAMRRLFKDKAEQVLSVIVMLFSFALAIGIFMVLPYFITSRFSEYIRSDSFMAIIEGVIRIAIFVLYVVGISLMKDIRRLYMYHGAEHKCINCIEKGRPLTVRNVMRSSKQHRRCGTSFMLFVMLVSVVLFFFIRVENPVYRVLIRIALIPVIAGISYEIIRLAGRSNNILVRIISVPGLWLQRLTTKEPDESMVEVAIAAVEAVFDWKNYLYEAFGYEIDESWLRDEEPSEDEESEEEALEVTVEEKKLEEKRVEERAEKERVEEDSSEKDESLEKEEAVEGKRDTKG